MKTSKVIKSILLISAGLFIVTISFSQVRPPHDPCWDMGSLDNWGNWDDHGLGTCHPVLNPSEIINACWRGCTNGDLYTIIDPE